MNDAQYTRYKNANNSRMALLTSKRNRDYSISFTVKGSSDNYIVSIAAKGGAVRCTCPDYRARSRNSELVCKHVIYVLMNVLGIIRNINHPFFSRRYLTKDEFVSAHRSFQAKGLQ